MTEHLSTDTHDMTDRLSPREQLTFHKSGYIVQSHINHIGEVIMEANNHNMYVREVLMDHLIPGGYCHISSLESRRTVHHAYAICHIAWDEYNKLAISIPSVKQHSPVEIYSIIDNQAAMLQSVLELLEKDIKTALYHMK